MANQTIRGNIIQRNDSDINWSVANPILAKGEMGINTDNYRVKIGDGVTTWNSLSYEDILVTDAFDTLTTDTVGRWTVTIPKITSLYDGLTIRIRLMTSYNGTYNTLNVNGLGDKIVWYRINERLTSHVPRYAELSLTYRTNAGTYTNGVTYTGGWVLQTHYLTGDTWNTLYYSENVNLGETIYGYDLLLKGIDNKWYPVTKKTSDSATATTTGNSNIDFLINSDVLWYVSGTDCAAGSNIASSNIRLTVATTISNPLYGTFAQYKNVYLVGTIVNGNFRIDTTGYWTHDLPTTDNDKVYLYLGYMSTASTMRLSVNHPIYWFKDGVVQPYATRQIINTNTATSGFTNGHYLYNNNGTIGAASLPTSLPANGGNADTVDGKHASDFAAYSHSHNYLSTSDTWKNEPLKIPANSDLNSYYTSGVYSSDSDGNSATILNRPPEAIGFVLYVNEIYGSGVGGRQIQLAIIRQTNNMYIRSKAENSAWTSWDKIYSVNNKPSASDIGAAASSHLHTIDHITDIAVGTCSTAIATAAKTLSVTNFVLRTGAIALVKFTYGNTAANPTLNINSTGAKPIFYNGIAAPTDLIVANDLITFMYDGTNWVVNGVLDYGTATTALASGGTGSVGTSNKIARADHSHTLPAYPTTLPASDVSAWAKASTKPTYTASEVGAAPTSHNHTIANITDIGVGTCSTAAATAAKVLTVTNFTLTTNSFVIVKFTVTNTASNPTLNVNGTGAKPIFYNGVAAPADLIVANDLIVMMYDGTNWVMSGTMDYATSVTSLTSGGTGTTGTSSRVARADHTHTLPAYPTIPTSLPANGGNADTVDGKHASEFSTATPLISGNNNGSVRMIGTKSDYVMGENAFAQGINTQADGDASYAEGISTRAAGNSSHAEGNNTCTWDEGSHAEGCDTTASGYASHAEGAETTAFGYASHAEGYSSDAKGECSHAEGDSTTASGQSSHAEGNSTTAMSDSAHAEGYQTTASGAYSHAEGYSSNIASQIITNLDTAPVTDIISAWGTNKFSLAYGESSHVGGKNCLATGIGSFAHGDGARATGNLSVALAYATASGSGSIASGSMATSSGASSIAIGAYIAASGESSIALGIYNTSSGRYSFCYGNNNVANSPYSYAKGYMALAKGEYATALGDYNEAGTRSTVIGNNLISPYYLATVIGRHNKYTGTIGTNDSNYSSSNPAILVGNGSSSSSRSNAFRVTFSGATYGLSAFNSTGADYAEYFEWKDKNPNNKDRIGLFVTLDEDKIRIANENDIYILGIVSGNASVIGNAHEDGWNEMYIRDEFGRLQYEDVDVPDKYEIIPAITEEVTGEDGITTIKIIEEEKQLLISPAGTEKRIKLNPNYDPDLEYVPRSERKEWDTVGMLGQLIVKDDGTCIPNSYCKCGKGGLATHSNEGYRVIKRISENVIVIILK